MLDEAHSAIDRLLHFLDLYTHTIRDTDDDDARAEVWTVSIP